MIEDREEILILFDIYGQLLTENQQNHIELYYSDDLSLAEIAENQGITRQGVRDSLSRAVRQLRLYDATLGLKAHFEQTESTLSEISRLAEEIKNINLETALSREINSAATRILTLVQMFNED